MNWEEIMSVNNPYKRRLFTQPSTTKSPQSHEQNRSVSDPCEAHNLRDINNMPNELKSKKANISTMSNGLLLAYRYTSTLELHDATNETMVISFLDWSIASKYELSNSTMSYFIRIIQMWAYFNQFQTSLLLALDRCHIMLIMSRLETQIQI